MELKLNSVNEKDVIKISKQKKKVAIPILISNR
jgi:hypothetical protein